MNKSHIHGSSYKAAFSGDKEQAALAVALDVRKFEIELYWKRAAYFWVFTGAALAGYLAAMTEKELAHRPQAMLLTSCVGLVFSFAWYLVNRASKFWQSNWEAHVDLLEDQANGPLYKTVLSDDTPWWELQGAYGFSVSKVNQLLSLFVVLLFAMLVGDTVHSHYIFSSRCEFFPTGCFLLTAAAVSSLVVFGRTSYRHRTIIRHSRKTTVVDAPE